MAKSYIHELGDKLSNGSTAANLPKHIKEIAPIMYNDGNNNFNSIQSALNGKAASTHSHGNITSDGKVGTTDNKPLITTTGGAVTTGSFGTSANTFCQGNDSRLSNARTPTAHASTATTYGVGSSTKYGHVKLYDNVTGSNTDGAPTQKAVKEAIAAVEGGKVKATAKSDNVNYKLLATASASPTSGALTEAVYDTDITLNPSTNTLTANLAGTATYAKALDPQMILNTTLYKVPVISADKEVRWSGAPGASGSTSELTYDNTDGKNLLSVNVTGYATSLEHAFSGSTVNETPIINVSGSTDGFKLTYGATTADLGIAKLYTTDDANAKLSFGNMVSSTYKEALAISNGSANLTGTVNGYTIGKSVPSDAKFTDTTYTANNGVSLSGTTFSNSGVRSTTINGNYLRVNTGGTNADLTIPYATSAHRLRAAYATFDNTTGYRLLAEIHPATGTSANRIATFDALFTHTANSYSLAHIYVNIRTNHGSSGDTYNYYWCYIDEKPAVSRTQILAYKKTGSNSLFLFAYESEAVYCGVQLSINQTSDYNGQYKDMDVVDLKQNDTLVASLDSSYTQVAATISYHNVLAATSQVGSTSVPVYVDSYGNAVACTVGSSNGLASLDANGKVPTSQLPNFGSGTVTSVATGVGLRGGTITDSGTISTNVPRNPSSDVNSPFPTSTTANTMEMQEYNGGTQSHCPSNTDWWHILSTVGSDTAYKTQLAQKMSDRNTPDLCIRVLASGTWGDWFSTRDASWIRTGTISTSRLPSNSSSSAGIVASGSGQQNRVWGTDSNGSPSWSKVRANMLESDINISGNCLTAGRNLDTNFVTIDNKKYKYLGKVVVEPWIRYSARFQVGPGDGQRNCDIMINIQRNGSVSGAATELDAVFFANTDGANLSDLGIYTSYDSSTYTYYFYLGVFNNLTFVRCLHSKGFSFDAPTTTPSSLTRIANNRKVILGPTNSGVGSVNTPVYVNSNGVLESCNAALTDKRNFPKLNFFYNGGNGGETNRYIKVANITCSMTYLNHPFIFRCLSRYQSMYTINIMFQSGDMTRPGIHRFNVEVPAGFSASTADVKITYDDSGTYRVYTLWVNPGAWSGVSTVLECEDQYASLVQITNEQYSTSLTNPITPQYIKYAQSVTPGSRIGNESTPIFMEDTGTLKPCTGGSLIDYEITSTVPSSPTPGKFYFIS